MDATFNYAGTAVYQALMLKEFESEPVRIFFVGELRRFTEMTHTGTIPLTYKAGFVMKASVRDGALIAPSETCSTITQMYPEVFSGLYQQNSILAESFSYHLVLTTSQVSFSIV